MHDGAPPRAPPHGYPGGPAGSQPSDRQPAGAPASSGPGAAAPEPAGLDLQAIARDWITLWQSELTAAATDRELQETWQTLAGLWAGAAGAMLRGLPRGAPDGRFGAAAAPGRAGPAAPARPAPAAAAPDARDAEIERLARRVADLERRLADLERNGGSG